MSVVSPYLLFYFLFFFRFIFSFLIFYLGEMDVDMEEPGDHVVTSTPAHSTRGLRRPTETPVRAPQSTIRGRGRRQSSEEPEEERKKNSGKSKKLQSFVFFFFSFLFFVLF